MKKFFDNYKSTVIMIISVVIGGILGLLFKEDISILKPLGDLFLNML